MSFPPDASPRRFVIGLGAILLLFALLRAPLVDVPMERDEGENAMFGLEMLRGNPPYSNAYMMKLPGGAAVDALLFSLFGPSTRTLHVALLVTNLLCIAMTGWLGRRLVGDGAGLFAAAAYGTFTIGMGMFGPWLSGEHFAVLFLLAGACLTLGGSARCAALGMFLLGMAMTVKQHAALPALGWACGLAAIELPPLARRERANRVVRMGFLFFAPLILTGIVMALCGVFGNFVFWTFVYASKYVTGVSAALGWEFFKLGVGTVVRDAPLLWAMALVGAACLAWRPPAAAARWLILPAALGGAAAAGAGLMFRGQYFILLAPFAALLAGVAWRALMGTIRGAGPGDAAASVGFSPARESVIVGGVAILLSFHVLLAPLRWGWTWKPEAVCRMVYGMNPFPEYPAIAAYVRAHTGSDETLAVFGSEPGIYFLADRRPASPHVCVYEMMKPHGYAGEMQMEAIRAVEKARPPCVVLINAPTSWGISEKSDPTFFKWTNEFLHGHYTLEGVMDLISDREQVTKWGEEARRYRRQSAYSVMIFLRNDRTSGGAR